MYNLFYTVKGLMKVAAVSIAALLVYLLFGGVPQSPNKGPAW